MRAISNSWGTLNDNKFPAWRVLWVASNISLSLGYLLILGRRWCCSFCKEVVYTSSKVSSSLLCVAWWWGFAYCLKETVSFKNYTWGLVRLFSGFPNCLMLFEIGEIAKCGSEDVQFEELQTLSVLSWSSFRQTLNASRPIDRENSENTFSDAKYRTSQANRRIWNQAVGVSVFENNAEPNSFLKIERE